jgi:hypothetical protein
VCTVRRNGSVIIVDERANAASLLVGPPTEKSWEIYHKQWTVSRSNEDFVFGLDHLQLKDIAEVFKT